MIAPYFRFRFKRYIRHVKQTPQRVVEFFSKNVFASGKKHAKIRKFTITWLSVVMTIFILTATQAYFERNTILVDVPTNGGTYREAVVGELDTFNPLFAIDGANADIAQLLFAGLLEYTPDGELVGELAESWESNETADKFTVVLKPDLTWHDGEQITSEDVAFTIALLQNPDTRSPRKDTWRGINTEIIDDRTIVFMLPNSFAPFPQILTVGIVPEHILSNIEPENMRISEFSSTQPIGSGPFVFQEFDTLQNRVIMNAFDNYAQGRPRLNRIIVRGYSTFEDAEDALRQKLVDGLGSVDEFGEYETDNKYTIDTPRLTIGNYLYMNATEPIFKDAKVRQAITRGIDRLRLQEVTASEKPVLESPFLDVQLRIIDTPKQLSFDQVAAGKLLNDAGWQLPLGSMVRVKDGKELNFTLSIPDRPSQIALAAEIKQQLSVIGVSVDIESTAAEDFQSDIVLPHNYSAALISITNGLDPDLFVFWHSSQAVRGGLNFSNIKDTGLDSSLEAGRTRTDLELREAKYEAFGERWRQLAPAVALNQEQYYYVRRERARGAVGKSIQQPFNRFDTVEKWTVLFEKVQYKDL